MLEAAEAPVKKEHDLQIRETRKLVEENLLVMLKLFAGKKQMSLKRREDNDSPEYSNFPPPPPPPPNKKFTFLFDFLLVYFKYSGNDRECSFRFAIALETL